MYGKRSTYEKISSLDFNDISVGLVCFVAIVLLSLMSVLPSSTRSLEINHSTPETMIHW